MAFNSPSNVVVVAFVCLVVAFSLQSVAVYIDGWIAVQIAPNDTLYMGLWHVCLDSGACTEIWFDSNLTGLLSLIATMNAVIWSCFATEARRHRRRKIVFIIASLLASCTLVVPFAVYAQTVHLYLLPYNHAERKRRIFAHCFLLSVFAWCLSVKASALLVYSYACKERGSAHQSPVATCAEGTQTEQLEQRGARHSITSKELVTWDELETCEEMTGAHPDPSQQSVQERVGETH